MIKQTLAVIALTAVAGCMGSGTSSGGSGVSQSANNFDTPTAATMMSDASHVASNNSFTSMLNNVRSSNGSGAVSYDARLGAAAQGHANDMLANNFFSHTGSNGSSGGDRISAQGYNWQTWGENIARGQQSEAEVLQAWVNSPGHQSNNINPNFEDFALAKAGSGSRLYWVLMLAREQR